MILGNKLKASIALTAVILAGAIMITSGIAVLYSAMDVTIATKSYVSRSFIESKVTSCIEEALYRINTNISYVGNYTVTFEDGTCTGTVAVDALVPTKRTINVVATYSDGYTLTRTMIVDTTTSPMTLSNF
jgi:hypothetical protein